MSAVLLLAFGILSALLVPVVGVVFCILLLVVQIAFMAVRAAVARNDAPRLMQLGEFVAPVFSVHVATHDEPPLMVARTLQALAVQDWPAERYEVIVIDNNTADPALWQPVRDLCTRLGPQFRFVHRMGVKGAKAGALNIALEQTREDVTHIVTVDADYVVAPRFLGFAAQALRKTGADYVQFPQAYAGCERVAAGVDAELEEYFRTNAQMADGSEAVLLTGTLCVISRKALMAVGGWSGRTTTEDAEIGVRLCRKGYSGRFIDRIVGRGYLPFSLRDLEQQRHRWASGNLQTLILHAPAILFGRDDMGWHRRGAILTQLTAWLNLSLIPALLLLGGLLTGWGGNMLLMLAAGSVLLSFADIVGRLVWRGLRDETPWAVFAAAIAHRVALAPISALATIEVLAGRQMRFVVTDKSGTVRGSLYGFPIVSFVLFTVAAFALPVALQDGWLSTVAILALMTPFPAALATARTLDRYRLILTRAGATA